LKLKIRKRRAWTTIALRLVERLVDVREAIPSRNLRDTDGRAVSLLPRKPLIELVTAKVSNFFHQFVNIVEPKF
jgi:hypothetical protein